MDIGRLGLQATNKNREIGVEEERLFYNKVVGPVVWPHHFVHLLLLQCTKKSLTLGLNMRLYYAFTFLLFISLFSCSLFPLLLHEEEHKMGQMVPQRCKWLQKWLPQKIKPTHMWKVDMVDPSKKPKEGWKDILGGLQSLHGFSSNISLAPTKHTHTHTHKTTKRTKSTIRL